jgi:MFS family permease
MPSERAPVFALAATTTAGYGILYYAFGVLLVAMEDDLGWSRTFLSGVLSLALVVAALLTIPLGRWLDHHPPRPLLLAGAVGSSALVVGWGAADNRFVFLVVWLLLGAGQALLFYEPAFTVLTKRFTGRSRHKAVTTVTLVGGLASTIFGPLTAALEDALGWRGALFVLAAVLLAITMPAFWWGLRGVEPTVRFEEESHAPAEVLRTPTFVLLTAAYVLSAMAIYAMPILLVPFLKGRGVGIGAAATILGAVGFVQVLGRSTFVRLTRNRPVLHLATAVLAAKGVGVILLVVLPVEVGVVAYVLVYGASNGISTLTRALTLAELYGPAHYGAISSVIAAVSAIGGAAAPFLAAAAADVVGLPSVFLGLAGLSLVSALCNEVVARPTRGGGQAADSKKSHAARVMSGPAGSVKVEAS